MTFVITTGCCNDASCISVCPVQCIRPRPGDPDFTSTEQLYIDPASCIDCGACVPECPVGVIQADDDLGVDDEPFLAINKDYFTLNPITDIEPLPSIRRRLPEGQSSLRVAIVGAGPAACYAAAELGAIQGVQVSIFDRLPTPFGLVRAGVAPDHPTTKLITDQFRTALSRKSVTCFFNVEVGNDITIEELQQHHHAVIWAAGVDDDNTLGIPGESLPGSHSAREFVAWYNGHPDFADSTFDLSSERVVVIGNGNVALDVARVLALPSSRFDATDMADHARDALLHSNVREVVVAARRAAHNAAYSLAEVLGLAQTDDIDLLAQSNEADVETILGGIEADPLLRQKLAVVAEAGGHKARGDRSSITLRFLLTPEAIHGEGRVEAVTFARSRVVVTDGVLTVEPTGEQETIKTSLVLRAIGYRGRAVPGLPFDEVRGIVRNDHGRVVSGRDEQLPGLYCAGWVKRGATGVIGTNKADSLETIDAILEDLKAGRLREPAHGEGELTALIAQRQPARLDNAGWQRIDRAEQVAGRASNRTRTKFVSVDEMLSASRLAAAASQR